MMPAHGARFPAISALGISAAAVAAGLADPAAQAGVQAAMDLLQPYNMLLAFTPAQRAKIKAGTTDFACAGIINAKITDQMALGRRVFYFPDGAYLISDTKGDTRGGPDNCFLYIRSDCVILGCGWGTLFKLDDGVTTAGDYILWGPADTAATNNFFLSGIRYDGNADNNVVTTTRTAYAVKVRSGDNIEISNNFFRNIPGRNIIVLGNNANPPSITDARVINNDVWTVGPATSSGSAITDHSSIYSQCDGAIIAHNRLRNPSVVDPALTLVPLEIHGRNTKVINNIVVNYTYGGNSVAQVHDSEHQLWEGNHFTISKAGWNFFGLNFTLRDIKFINNHITLDFGGYQPAGMIYQGRGLNVSTTPEDMLIEGNTFYCAVSTALAHSWSGLDFTCVKGLTIRNNKIRNVQGSGILLNNNNSNQGGGFDKVVIEDNDIENCGLLVAVTEIYGIHVKNGGTTVTMTIATPGVVTWPLHPFVVGDEMQFTTTGALPTGLTASTTYFIQSVPTASTFTLAASPGGSAIATSGSQSGVHTGIATGRLYRSITIDNNQIGKETAAGVGNMRGIRIEGPGPVTACRTKGRNRYRGITRVNRYSTSSATLFRDVTREPRIVYADRTVNSANPVMGYFEAAGEQVQCPNPASTAVFVKRVSTDGAANEGTRADTTAYSKGAWIKDSGTVVYEALNSGVTGTGNPTAPGVGSTVVDGTITWLEVDTVAAAFSNGYTFP